MKLKVKDVDISSGGVLVGIINKEDAELFDLHTMDRVNLVKGKRKETIVVDISHSSKTIKKGHIGLFEEVIKSLKVKQGDVVNIVPARKPWSIEYIKKKLDGKRLNKKEIDQIVWDIVHNKLNNIELTYFVSACYSNRLSMKETVLLTKAMAKEGETLNFKDKIILDKHCIGGIPGNRTTMVLVPIIAALGYKMPKTSSRSITSPAGTADTMESLAKVEFSLKDMKKIVNKNNGCIVWGGALNLAPADDKIITVEKPLDIDAESQLLASIMAKKFSVNPSHVLIDIPTGEFAKIINKKKAMALKKEFKSIGKKLGMKVKVMITDGSQPIGNGIGPLLEARDVLWLLRRDPRRPLDLEKKCVMMAVEMLKMIGVKTPYKKVIDVLESGKAYEKMYEIIKAQDGKFINPDRMKLAKYSKDIISNKKGVVKKIDNKIISKVARIAGAPQDNKSGIYLYKHVGDNVNKKEKLFTIYSSSKEKLKYALDTFDKIDGVVVR